MSELQEALAGATVESDAERRDLGRLHALAAGADTWAAAWSRALPLHVTGSALVVHPATGRVLLRWHERQRAWIQVGGHGDPGEGHPLAVATREAIEETGLDDLRPWPDAVRPRIMHAVIVPVPANDHEPAHEHGDLRYVLATELPDRATAEHDGAEVRWLSVDEAIELTTQGNVQESLRRVRRLLVNGDAVGRFGDEVTPPATG